MSNVCGTGFISWWMDIPALSLARKSLGQSKAE